MKQKVYKTVQPIRSKKDREKLSNYFRSKNLRDYALFEFGIKVGRRISDLVKLNVEDVTYLDERGRFCMSERLIIQEQKTGKFSTLYINEIAQRALSKYLKQRIKFTPLEDLMTQPLFKSRKHGSNGECRLGSIQAWRILNNAAQACGLDYKIGTHSLRKTFGYVLYRQGVSIELIQKIFNHSSQDITLAYIGIMQDDIDKALREMR